MSDLAVAVEAALGGRDAVAVERVVPVGGGCISEVARVELGDGRSVLAKSAAGTPDGLLAAEADGLRWLAEGLEGATVTRVPGVLALTRDVLVTEWVEPGRCREATGEALGRGLALLHAAGAPRFGGPRDGFIGTLPQRNVPGADDWPTFWFTHRIEPLTALAHDRGALPPGTAALVDRLADRLAGLAGPPEPPARLHGDLWWGNVHVDTQGIPWLIDPAAYGGHREADLAMLTLFGDLPPALVAAYEAQSPLADGWRERLRLWQLEPLLVHAALFSGGYGASARAVLDRWA
ncbi:MAG TPA: fructosamine kinase family protein [Acidimicrobiales bacterium]